MGIETHKTFCRFCHANCAMLVDVEDGKVIEVRGDPEDPEFGGYTCVKGRELPDSHNAEHRLHASLVRDCEGNFQPTPMPEALAAWGCDDALWYKIKNKKGLRDLLKKGDEERGRERIQRFRELLEEEERAGGR